MYRLRDLIQQGNLRVQKREAELLRAKEAWLNSAAEYALLKKKADDLELIVISYLKKADSLSSLVKLNADRLDKVHTSVAEKLDEIEDEVGIVQEILGYINSLSKFPNEAVTAVVLHMATANEY